MTRFDSYTRTPWYKDHPEWRHVLVPVKTHNVYSATREIFSKKLGKYKAFVDFGLSYSDKTSTVNSSRINFRTNVGIAYKNFSIHLRHTSNGDTGGENAGEDAIMFEWRF